VNRAVALPAPLEQQRRWLGLAGLMPFAACLAVVAVADDPRLDTAAIRTMLHYAAVIAAFLGAVHWGLAGQEHGPRAERLWWGVTPALVAWALLAAPDPVALIGFAALFGLILLVDLRWLAIPDPGYRALRIPLTVAVVGMLLTATALLLGGL
jgi:hypothetical protein